MPLTSSGRVYSCPCCGLGIPFAFEEKQLLTLQPPTAQYSTARGADTPITRVTRKFRVCRQCGYIVDLPSEDENNKWAALNAARLKASPALSPDTPRPFAIRPPMRLDATKPEPLLQAGPTSTNGISPVVADDEVEFIELSDLPDPETPPSAAGTKAATKTR